MKLIIGMGKLKLLNNYLYYKLIIISYMRVTIKQVGCIQYVFLL